MGGEGEPGQAWPWNGPKARTGAMAGGARPSLKPSTSNSRVRHDRSCSTDWSEARGEYARFALANAVAFAQVWLVSVGLARLVFPAIGFRRHADTVAHLIGLASPVWTSYLGHKHFSFRAERRSAG
jgi:hypothetical protein